MNNAKNLLRNPRIIIFILAILGAIFAIHPGYTSEGTMDLTLKADLGFSLNWRELLLR
jgi:hypothetical protein